MKLSALQAFALACVAATSLFFGYLAFWLINILSSPDWCSKAVQAERITPGNSFQGLTGCIDILKMQVGAVAQTLLIVVGTFALCLGVLMVIVVAGARLAGKLFGGEIDVGKQSAPAAAQAVADSAQNKADDISGVKP